MAIIDALLETHCYRFFKIEKSMNLEVASTHTIQYIWTVIRAVPTVNNFFCWAILLGMFTILYSRFF
jgi:hypothetical protein